jgi:hypothetical protein
MPETSEQQQQLDAAYDRLWQIAEARRAGQGLDVRMMYAQN